MTTYDEAYYNAILKRFLHEEMVREGIRPGGSLPSHAKQEIAFRVYQRLMLGEMDAAVRKEFGDRNE